MIRRAPLQSFIFLSVAGNILSNHLLFDSRFLTSRLPYRAPAGLSPIQMCRFRKKDNKVKEQIMFTSSSGLLQDALDSGQKLRRGEEGGLCVDREGGSDMCSNGGRQQQPAG